MPKIAFVHSNNNDVGGSDLAMWRVVCACRDAGYDTLVAISRRNLIWERYERERIAIQQVPYASSLQLFEPFHFVPVAAGNLRNHRAPDAIILTREG